MPSPARALILALPLVVPASVGLPVATAQDAAGSSDHRGAASIFRRTLLREGSDIIEAHGRVVRDEASGTWIFHVGPDHASAAGYQMTLLPSARLEEIVRAVQAMPRMQAFFEITGRVYVYENVNYLLPTHAPQLTELVPVEGAPASRPAAPPEAAPAPVEPEPDLDADAPSPDVAIPEGEAGAFADQVRRNLREAVGPVARTSGPGLPTLPEARPARGADRDRQAITAEGTMLLSRRGRVRRDIRGAWIFVFDADAEGLADPPMVLMPCQLLERIAGHASRGETGAIIVSGRVFAFHGVNYLLPTVFQVARERTRLTP